MLTPLHCIYFGVYLMLETTKKHNIPRAMCGDGLKGVPLSHTLFMSQRIASRTFVCHRMSGADMPCLLTPLH